MCENNTETGIRARLRNHYYRHQMEYLVVRNAALGAVVGMTVQALVKGAANVIHEARTESDPMSDPLIDI